MPAGTAIINKRKFCMWRVNANRHTGTECGRSGGGAGAGASAVWQQNVKLMHKVYSSSNKINKNNKKNEKIKMKMKSQNAAERNENTSK